MQQLRELYKRLTPRQRLTLAAVALGVCAAIYGLVIWQRDRDFKPLYTGLSAADAGAVTARLRERNIDFRLQEAGDEKSTILVPSARVAEARLDLAATGLPKTGRIGYELFDKANFGVTDFAEQVNYHRALEGELERSVMALGEVEAARVHVTLAKDSVFADSRQPAKASVMVRLRRGRTLARPSVEALQHLTASAVEGLEPLAVSVIDMQGNLLSRPVGAGTNAGASDGEKAELLAQYRRKLETDLLAKVNQTLEPLLGPERFRAGVSVDLDLASGEQSEELFDPAKSVMVSQQRSEEVSAPQSAGGVPGTPSTLPRPASRPFGQGSNVSRRTENVTFQTSRTVRKSTTPQGVMKRLSLSVLVDQTVRWEGAGAKAKRVIDPPKPEEIKAIRELVAGAVGFSTSRGDQLIVESLPFESTLRLTPPAPVTATGAAPSSLAVWPESLRGPLGWALLAGAFTLLLVGGGAILFLRRKSKKRAAAELAAKEVEAGGPAAALGAAAGAGAVDGTPGGRELPAGQAKTVEEMLAEKEHERERAEAEELAKLQAATVATTKTDILTKHVSEEARKNPAAIAQVLRNWLEETA